MSNDANNSDIKVHTPKVLNCAICLDDIESDVQFLPCIHSFHGECINAWIREQPVCPICKVPVYVNTTEQLDRYNHHKSYQDRVAEEEASFFQQVSAGVYNNELPVDNSYLQYDFSNGLNNFRNSISSELSDGLVAMLDQLLSDDHSNVARDLTRTQRQGLSAAMAICHYAIGRPDEHKENIEENAVDTVNSMNESHNNILDSNGDSPGFVNQITPRYIPNTALNQINTEIRSNVNNEPEFGADSGRNVAMQYLIDIMADNDRFSQVVLPYVNFTINAPLPSVQLLQNIPEEPVAENNPNQPTDDSDDGLI